MRKYLLFFFAAVLLMCRGVSFGFELAPLHEKADTLSVEQANDLVNNKPDDEKSLYLLALTYLNVHKDREAGEVFERAIYLKPGFTEAKWGIAEVKRRQHDYKQAETLLSEVIKEKPDFAPAYITLGYIRYVQMNYNAAVKLAYKVLKMKEGKVDTSNHVRAHLILSGAKGMIAHNGGPLSKVINGTAVLSNIKKAQAMQPGSAGVLFGLGTYYLIAPSLAGGDAGLAEEYLTRAIKADPLFADAYVRLGQLYLIKGDKSRYEEYLDQALKIDPQNELALDIKNKTCKLICLGS